MMNRFLTIATLTAIAALAYPAAAQDDMAAAEPTDDVCMAIVYGNDDAPQCEENLIVVIARLPEGDRYRIPQNLRLSDDAANNSWADRVESLEMIGDFGTLSCSTVGAGSFTGCTQKLIEQAYGERREGSEVRFSELIAAARQERLSTIDQDAAEEQERVEEIEQEYIERLERERAGSVGDEVLDPGPLPGAIVNSDGLPAAEPSKDTPFDDGDEEVLPLPR
ncbi:MAG: hypothetical protein WA948_02445 [Pontixanthobacter sp.]